MKIYAISGLGANKIAFEKLQFSEPYQLEFIPWEVPKDNDTVKTYAARWADKIDDTKEFGLLGLSFGGIMAQEIAKIKPPKFLLLFDTIKSDKEKPFWIRWNRTLPLYKLFPIHILNHTSALRCISKAAQYINPHRPNIDAMYTLRDKEYTRWAIREVIFWDNTSSYNFPVHHFHGTWDYLFPIRNIRQAIPVERGGHLAIYEKADIVNKTLAEIL